VEFVVCRIDEGGVRLEIRGEVIRSGRCCGVSRDIRIAVIAIGLRTGSVMTLDDAIEA
jgi:hypothetical protein